MSRELVSTRIKIVADVSSIEDLSKLPRTASARPAAKGSRGTFCNPSAGLKTQPVVTHEPDAMSDGVSSSYSDSRVRAPVSGSHRQLFDGRRHDAILFWSRKRHYGATRLVCTPDSFGILIGSVAHCPRSAKCPLSSATDSSSASSALFDSSTPGGRKSEDSASHVEALLREWAFRWKGVRSRSPSVECRILV